MRNSAERGRAKESRRRRGRRCRSARDAAAAHAPPFVALRHTQSIQVFDVTFYSVSWARSTRPSSSTIYKWQAADVSRCAAYENAGGLWGNPPLRWLNSRLRSRYDERERISPAVIGIASTSRRYRDITSRRTTGFRGPCFGINALTAGWGRC